LAEASFFATPTADPFTTAVPLPGLLLSVFVPFWERARVFARYGLLLGNGRFPVAGWSVSTSYGWARALVLASSCSRSCRTHAGCAVPAPSHPAFDWLKGQQLDAAQSWTSDPGRKISPTCPSAATRSGLQSITTAHCSRRSSVWPPHIEFLDRWLSVHPHPFQNLTSSDCCASTACACVLHVRGLC